MLGLHSRITNYFRQDISWRGAWMPGSVKFNLATSLMLYSTAHINNQSFINLSVSCKKRSVYAETWCCVGGEWYTKDRFERTSASMNYHRRFFFLRLLHSCTVSFGPKKNYESATCLFAIGLVKVFMTIILIYEFRTKNPTTHLHFHRHRRLLLALGFHVFLKCPRSPLHHNFDPRHHG